MRRVGYGLVLLILIGSRSSSAQTYPAFEKVLVPISIAGEVAGAHGSRWKSAIVISNRSDSSIFIPGVNWTCPLSGCGWANLAARSTVFARLHHFPYHDFVPGTLILVEQGRVGDLAFSLRIQDVSRQSLTWGTSIPVVPESQAATGSLDLLNIPNDPRFRVHLRVYDFFPRLGSRVRIVGYQIDESVTEPPHVPQEFLPLFDVERDLVPYIPDGGGFEILGIGYSFLDLREVTIAPTVGRLGIRVEALSNDTRFWAFASVTNNETQHVTVLTPE